ncbi:sigma-54-dependent Fis family transcriptional regulator [Mesobaculum littorinae]|uniref:Sigma-54-dependent Fis family transcriptional regulator n=1 Tax=Mesobaculum littorinae TaxID=2486419 RepID=A0A438AL20_9RHOB|nr:XylR N-terminal domain-containing protein [Mesobaculum littorinae]RVV99369.1 sigma-54-dependent Fis family transcriptional regulator [Mesobaculum littorinae]
MPRHISLSEASRRAPAILERGDSDLLKEGAAPTLEDLAGALQFALGDGRVWLNDERMLLLQSEVLGQLRAAMIHEIGMDRTRERLMQVGWEQGVRYANLVANRFGKSDMTAALAAGPRIHTMAGHAKVVTKRFEFNLRKLEYLGEFHWIDSAEGAEHLRNFGTCDCPACWMQVAVPSGYTSALLGFPVIFREVECIAQGAQRCVIMGKDAAAWGGDMPEFKMFGIDQPPRPPSRPWTPPSDIPQPQEDGRFGGIIGNSPAIQRVRRLAEKAATNRVPVMFIGEPGVGKEHFARYLHRQGETPQGPFVPVYCSALDGPADKADRVLFGDDGLIAQATGGTLFLNDVLALPQVAQANLTRLLHDGRKQRFRVISAASRSPLDAVAEGAFRADLHYILSLLPIHTPPLRERREDIPALVETFLGRFRAQHRKPVQGLAGGLTDMLLRYDFPGNVRELSNMIERGVIYAEPGGQIDIRHVFTGVEVAPDLANRIRRDGALGRTPGGADPGGIEGRERSLTDLEIEAVISALNACDWNVSAAARKLGVTRAKLDYRIRKHGLDRQT